MSLSAHGFDLSQVEFHSFHWDNFNQDVLNAHKKVMAHFGLNVTYTQENIPHGQWLDRVIGQSKSKVVAIIEPDLIPLNKEIIEKAAQYVFENDTFLGCAQVSNHIHPATHVFASPAFFFITPSCYEKLGRPSFLETRRADVAEELTFAAERIGLRFKTLFPKSYERAPVEGVWRLGSYGHYGIGTVFDGGVYHLFQSRLAANVDLFVTRCEEVVAGRFDDGGFIPCTGFDKPAQVVAPPYAYPWFCKTDTLRRWYRSYKKRTQ